MVELSSNAQKILDLLKDLSVVELNALVKAIEEEFGITAAAMAVAGPAAGAAGDGGAVAKDTVNIEITDVGQQKIAVIKEVKELLNLGLKEAKDLVEKAPVIVKENVKSEEADVIKGKLEAVGAKVTLK
jgi:large subunit ribosomal protein L7/L12